MKFSITITSIYTGIHLSNWKWQIQDGRWFQFLIYVINDVIMTSQLGLKILNDLANFSILSDTSMYFRFIATLREIWILPINSTIWRFNGIKLRHGVNQVMPRCEFDVRIMSGFEVIRRASDAPPPVPPSSRLHKAKKKRKNSPGLNRVKMQRPQTTTTDKNATAHNQYHVTVCHERLSQGRGAVLNTTKECFCKSTFISTLICAQL